MDDKDAIIAAVKDYWEGWFGGDAERMERALRPGSYQDWSRRGENPVDDSSGHDRLDSRWDGRGGEARIYREYLHLVKTADGWRILNALYARTR